jgi:hypothetical protein
MEEPFFSSPSLSLSQNKVNSSKSSHPSGVRRNINSQVDDYDAALLLASIRDDAKPIHEKPTNRKCMPFPSIEELERYFVRTKASSKNNKTYDTINSSGEARLRAVSMDVNASSKSSISADRPRTTESRSLEYEQYQGRTLVSPPTSPSLHPMPLVRQVSSPARTMDRRKRYLDEIRLTDDLTLPSPDSKLSKPYPPKLKSPDKSATSKKNIQRGAYNIGDSKILHKKFSWRNYPELEKFLIENREEYLYHSALNYTMEQKQYNNKLTQRLIDLANSLGYKFDPSEFNFVQIRDRIRCYFKSYVQSRKKKGVAIRNSNLKAKFFQTDRSKSSTRSG